MTSSDGHRHCCSGTGRDGVSRRTDSVGKNLHYCKWLPQNSFSSWVDTDYPSNLSSCSFEDKIIGECKDDDDGQIDDRK
ncbi:hypothetical protein P5673_019566 [Acropora cervicornis]|uniref:Uncharacterized protein n=1 Tax=Acropora cervicornis TaxID=6130 RepID=A0AAD9QB64_ACRCE|nr:hypothetical protein P5673_019566 [Acropora cervicornis]